MRASPQSVSTSATKNQRGRTFRVGNRRGQTFQAENGWAGHSGPAISEPILCARHSAGLFTQPLVTDAVQAHRGSQGGRRKPTDVWHASGSQPPLAVGRDTGPRVRCTPCWLGRIAAVSRDALTPSRVRSRLIEFVLDGRPKVNTCRQLVQQRKQALRVGLLEPGDQLPKVRDVAQSLVVNPNSVLKAYRELEIEGLAAGRRVSARSCSARRPVRPGQSGRTARGPGGLAAPGAGGRVDQGGVVALVDTMIRALGAGHVLVADPTEPDRPEPFHRTRLRRAEPGPGRLHPLRGRLGYLSPAPSGTKCSPPWLALSPDSSGCGSRWPS